MLNKEAYITKQHKEETTARIQLWLINVLLFFL